MLIKSKILMVGLFSVLLSGISAMEDEMTSSTLILSQREDILVYSDAFRDPTEVEEERKKMEENFNKILFEYINSLEFIKHAEEMREFNKGFDEGRNSLLLKWKFYIML